MILGILVISIFLIVQFFSLSLLSKACLQAFYSLPSFIILFFTKVRLQAFYVLEHLLPIALFFTKVFSFFIEDLYVFYFLLYECIELGCSKSFLIFIILYLVVYLVIRIYILYSFYFLLRKFIKILV